VAQVATEDLGAGVDTAVPSVEVTEGRAGVAADMEVWVVAVGLARLGLAGLAAVSDMDCQDPAAQEVLQECREGQRKELEVAAEEAAFIRGTYRRS
jgi:hypothetical protein